LCLAVHGAGTQGHPCLLQVAARPQVDRGGARHPRSEHEKCASLGRKPVARGHRQNACRNEKTRSRNLDPPPADALAPTKYPNLTLIASSSELAPAACGPR